MSKNNQFVCQNNPEHVFEKATDDFWCPTCPRELRSSLGMIEVLSKPDGKKVVDESNILEQIEIDPIVTESVEKEVIEKEVIETEVIATTTITTEPVTEDLHKNSEPLPVSEPVVKRKITSKSIIIETCNFGEYTWMRDYLKIKDLDALSFAETPEDWKEAQVSKKPVYCFPNEDQNLGDSLGLLYNWYAVQLISMHPPNGFRIPNSNDIIDLNQTILRSQESFLASDFAIHQSLPIAHRLPLATFADGTNDRCFWTSEQYGFYTAYSYRIDLDGKIARTRKIDKNAGYFIRCIQNS